MIYLTGALAVAYIVCIALARGSSAAMTRAWAIAIIAPCWIGTQIASAEIDLRLIASAVALVCLFLVRDRTLPLRPTWSDLAAAALVVVQLGSEYHNGGFGLKALFQVVSQWGLPYLFGRLLFRDPTELRRMQPVVGALCLALSLWVISESISGVNAVNRALNHTGSGQSEHERRWGLRRAEGPTSHPIFCGLLLVSLFPWTLHASQMARDGDGPTWWRALPWLQGMATCCTMSRGPQAALVASAAAVAFIRWPRVRIPAVVGIASLAILATAGRGMLVDVLHSWSKESVTPNFHVVIAGKEYEYTGTSHRVLQFLVFREALAAAGLLGYGVESVSARPLLVPNVEPHLLISPFDSIDNHYIYFALAAGHLALASFVMLGWLSAWGAWKLGRSGDSALRVFAAGLFSTQLAVMASLATVWFSDDFGFQWLFNAGLLASWRSYVAGQQRVPEVLQPLRRMRLVPGHPEIAPLETDPQLASI
ncbi:MAG TPA: hypothetical protein VG713_11425 [Pirellulales bacterium]|nr:hypothetical protein [Pirellulales bacterium]